MKIKTVLLLGLLFLVQSFWSCQDTTKAISVEDSQVIFSDSIDLAINRRLKFIDKKFFEGDSALVLRPEQRKALYPILGEKIMLINESDANAKNFKDLQIKRKAIREAWHTKIEAVLDTNQIFLRQSKLSLRNQSK